MRYNGKMYEGMRRRYEEKPLDPCDPVGKTAEAGETVRSVPSPDAQSAGGHSPAVCLADVMVRVRGAGRCRRRAKSQKRTC